MAKGGNYKLGIRIGGQVDHSFGQAFSRAQKELDSLYQISKRTNQGFLTSVNQWDSFADKTFSFVKKGAEAASAGLVGGLTASVLAGSAFEEQMSAVQAISQASSGEMEKLTVLAKKLGADTKFSAQEAASGLEYMAMAGWKTEDMLAGLSGVMNLAAASGEELSLVSDIVTDAMTAFGLSASQSAEFADVLAQASSKSNTNVAMMGETFQYVAPVAGSMGFSIYDTAVAVGLMANAGIKGSQAGTSLRAMLSRLVKPTKEVRSSMERLGLTIADSDGKMKSLDEIMRQMRTGFAGLSEAEQGSTAAALAGQEAMSGLLAIVNASENDFESLTKAISHSAGAAEEMSTIRMDNLRGDVEQLKGSMETASLEVYEGLKDPLRQTVQFGTEWVNSFTENLTEELPSLYRQVKHLGNGFSEAFGPILDLGEWFLEHPNVVSGGLSGIAAALFTFKTLKGATVAWKLLGKLSGLISVWPVAAAGLIIGGISGISTAINQVAKGNAEQNLAEHFGDLNLSMEELGQTARQILGNELFDHMEAMERSSGKAEAFISSMKKNIQKIQKTGWKLSVGMELERSETEDYASTVDAYVQNAQNYISEKGYELDLAVSLVFGRDGAGFSGEMESFYQSLLFQLEPLKANLSAALQGITEEGLTLDKQKIVDGYLKEMADLTAMITEAENAAKLQMIQGKFSGASLDSDTFQNLQATIADYTAQANEATEEAYQKILTSLNAQRIAGTKGMDGGISQTEFEERSLEAAGQYYRKKAETVLNGYQAIQDTIMETYGNEIQPALESIQSSLENSLNEIFEVSGNSNPEDYVNALNKALEEALNEASISTEARDALGMLLKTMEPTKEQLEDLTEQMKLAGQEIPEALRKGMTDLSVLGAAAGKEESLWQIIGTQIADSPERALLLETVQQQTGQIPEAAIAEITDRYEEAEEAARGFLEAMGKQFNDGLHVTVPVSIKTIKSEQGQEALKLFGGTGKKIPGHADGGIFDTPHFAAFAEEGPEAAVPLDGSRRSVAIWQEAGRILGTWQPETYSSLRGVMENLTKQESRKNQTNSVSMSPTFSPVVHIHGNADQKEIERGIQISFEQFQEYMERYQAHARRVSFS